ncbi:hypothetical protein GCM10027594_23420 [Hymenobacter agri]
MGTAERQQHELELNAELLAERIKQFRKRAKLTQMQLGERIGVQKAQIPKFEKDATSVSVSTMALVKRLVQRLNGRVADCWFVGHE